MNLDLSDTVRFFGIILMLIAVIFTFINILTKGFSFKIIWFRFIFIIGLGALIIWFYLFTKK